MEQIGLSVGGLVTKLIEKLAPALILIASGFKHLTDWMERHKQVVEAVSDILLPVTGAILGVALAVKAWAGAQWLLNIAITANPIGAFVVGIAAIAGGAIYAYKHFEKFRAVLWGLWETIKEFGRIVGDIFTGLWHVIHGVFTMNASEIKLISTVKKQRPEKSLIWANTINKLPETSCEKI